MKRLYLLRHAKSSWKDRSLADRERPLAGRGRRAANAIAAHLEAEGSGPSWCCAHLLGAPGRRSTACKPH
jgi:phosphohistidine phosphatase